MKKGLCLFALVLSALLLPGHQAAAAEKGKGYDAYTMVKTRNIFDPNRRATTRSEQRSTSPRIRVNAFTLTGTMVADGRSLAFFNGTRSEYSKVAVTGDTIANYHIVAVTPLQVELEADGHRQVLAVGRQLQLEGSAADPAEPEPAPDAAAPGNGLAPATGGVPSAGITPNSTAQPPPAGDKSEIIRRMMEKRRQETSK